MDQPGAVSTTGLTDDSAALAEQAAGGGFAVDPATARQLLTGVHRLRDYLDSTAAGMGIIAEKPALSETLTARWAGDEMTATATAADGFLTRVDELRRALPQIESAFTDALRTYQDMDVAGGETVRGAGPGSSPR